MQLKDLNPHPNNPRKISDPKLKMLAKSLKEFGDLSGIVFNKTTGRLVGGHQRLKVLPPDAKIVMDTDTHGHVIIGKERFQYREVEWDELKEKAANIAANKHGGEFELTGLSDWLLELDQNNFDLELTGFDNDELANLMAPVTKLDPQCDEDEVPDHVEPKTKLGDLYILGNHRLLCGDSTNIQHVERLMNGERADMVLTDPPYGIGFEYNSHKDVKGSQYTDFCSEWFHNIQMFSDFIVIFTGWAYNGFWYSKQPKDTFYWLCRNKRSGGSISNFRKVEPIFIWGKPANKYDFDYFDVTTKIDPELYKVHTCPKQIELIEQLLAGCKDKGIVLDVFGGSGSTIIGCEKTERKGFAMELDPHYCDVIVARWEKYTGKKATLQTSEGQANA